jgi:hypothetical protein
MGETIGPKRKIKCQRCTAVCDAIEVDDNGRCKRILLVCRRGCPVRVVRVKA